MYKQDLPWNNQRNWMKQSQLEGLVWFLCLMEYQPL